MSDLAHLFVYGTLAPGESNAHILAPLSGSWQPATIRGTLLPQGRGAALGFPAVILDPKGAVIPGQIFSSAQLTAHWPRIDAFEGEGYERVRVMAQLPDGAPLETFVYALHPSA